MKIHLRPKRTKLRKKPFKCGPDCIKCSFAREMDERAEEYCRRLRRPK